MCSVSFVFSSELDWRNIRPRFWSEYPKSCADDLGYHVSKSQHRGTRYRRAVGSMLTNGFDDFKGRLRIVATAPNRSGGYKYG